MHEPSLQQVADFIFNQRAAIPPDTEPAQFRLVRALTDNHRRTYNILERRKPQPRAAPHRAAGGFLFLRAPQNQRLSTPDPPHTSVTFISPAPRRGRTFCSSPAGNPRAGPARLPQRAISAHP